jgi:hypothetical protein
VLADAYVHELGENELAGRSFARVQLTALS